ncbi:MAG: hypothetical protein KJ583_04010 [Nanoarchaeota archaeon]|nr:hypothetical protein [Nanoarchaeota archaeon]MBU1270137.1 hypothetical protein [Nanoarchaeota archaeon]MBU1604457.1 hypothetical protein [Nanoarchaeota archaeon]MBU2443466.1 hypothetical protein [Nanoarchaeota archaeon]
MAIEIPQYGLKAYALLFSKHSTSGEFRQSELDWIVSTSMKKKIFSLLLRTGWIKKNSQGTYSCINPTDVIRGLLEFRVPEIIKNAGKIYAFTQLSAVEIWSDFSYVQRGLEKSPYFIKILKKDLKYWKTFFNRNEISNYINSGGTIGEFIILIPVSSLSFEEKNGFKVDSLKETIKYAKSNDVYAYASEYIKKKYGALA